jgi:2-hydroxyacyl-CoA lyase 1
MAGTHHAEANAWPLMLMAGSSESYQQGMGAFQELDQVGLLKPHVKWVQCRPLLSRDKHLNSAVQIRCEGTLIASTSGYDGEGI